MINWAKYFDKIYCINYIPYIKRKKLMESELKRIGILDSGIFEWQYTYENKLDKNFETYIKEKNHKYDNIINISLMLGHYYAIRDAYTKGYKKILMLEDDARFLRDLDKIELILNNRPENANVILYDKFVRSYNLAKQFKYINKYYSIFYSVRSTACYELDWKGMQKIIELVEKQPMVYDGYFWQANRFIPDLNHYCTNTNLAVQAIFSNSQVMTRFNESPLFYQMWYKYQEISFDDYYMREDGSPYYYGDYIEK